MNSTMNSDLTALNIDSNDKAATIYRTGALHYTYVCSQCKAGLFTNISDILDHIETHFNCAEYANDDDEEAEIHQYRPVDDDPIGSSASVQCSISQSTDRCFKCVLCDENCESQDYLNHHHLAKHSEHRCQFCVSTVVYDTASKLLTHLIDIHLNGTQLICSICSERFVCKTEFHRHLQTHGTINIKTILSDITISCGNSKKICVELKVEECNIEWMQCDICNSNFDKKSKLTLHMRKEHHPQHIAVKRGMYLCDRCNRNIQGKFLFYAHQYAHLMGSISSQFKDDVDDASLVDKLKTFLNDNISYDESVPEKAFGCRICCHLSVKRRKNIETHILQEHVYRLKCVKRSEKRFPCEYCDKTFTLSHNMTVHKRIHTQERPYVCHICNKSFSHSSYMKYHEKVHTGLATHQCALCGIAFKSQTKLNQHNKVHSTETTKCPICGKEFKAHRLNVHIKHVHHNEHRPYKCTVCLQAFKTAKTLKTHSYRHSGEKKYKCRFHCDERFTSTAGRRGHERSKHETN